MGRVWLRGWVCGRGCSWGSPVPPLWGLPNQHPYKAPFSFYKKETRAKFLQWPQVMIDCSELWELEMPQTHKGGEPWSVGETKLRPHVGAAGWQNGFSGMPQHAEATQGRRALAALILWVKGCGSCVKMWRGWSCAQAQERSLARLLPWWGFWGGVRAELSTRAGLKGLTQGMFCNAPGIYGFGFHIGLSCKRS